MKTKLVYSSDYIYVWEDQRSMRREYGTVTPNGNTIEGLWVLRDRDGKYIDYDRYRFDIAPRHDLEI